jgi:LDH2 family malate/lactate/ureidoglycolate dehydrogenase
MTNDVLVSADRLGAFLVGLFSAVGMEADNAKYCAECVVLTNLWGIDSHGALRVPIYAERLANKVIAANPVCRTEAGKHAFEIMNGDNGMGYLVGRAAMARAIELARSHGIGAVSVKNSNHFGAASLYAKMATDAGLVGIAMTNVVPNLVVPGGSKPITGNNPIAVGVPTAEPFPFMLDISMSSVAGGKLLLASKRGEKIPLDWATDSQGQFTDDPDIGFKGFLLPVGGHKGFGLSLVVDILSGVISGGAFQFGLGGMYKTPDKPSDTGHMMLAIDPEIALDHEAFLERMRSFYSTLKASPMWQQDREMLMPGELEYRSQLRRRKEGIPFPPDLLSELSAVGERHKVGISLVALASA